jgi:hypothetical protein
MNDVSVTVMIGIAWTFGVINLAPDLVFVLIGEGYLPPIGTLSNAWSEWIYVLTLAAVGPLALWLLSRRRRAEEWRDWERND